MTTKTQPKFTPGPWFVRFHPQDEEEFHVAGPMTPDHPYHSKYMKHIEVLSDEKYPRKLADARLIATAPMGYELAQMLDTLGTARDRGRIPAQYEWNAIMDKAYSIIAAVEEG